MTMTMAMLLLLLMMLSLFVVDAVAHRKYELKHTGRTQYLAYSMCLRPLW